ncbi:MAG TPA: serine hydrolase domain-containing protein [Steroidobacteraceae bacterium]|nr:serine hydrolase domain-containing protein [Steroidobacteraceae bacterium]
MKATTLVVACALFACAAHAQSPSTLTAAAVDPIFAAWSKPGSPGVAVTVTEHGAISFSKGYGSAQLEFGIPITDQTVFHSASISKQFTALAILLLEQDGKLSLDATIDKYLDWAPRTQQPITVRQLILHTSGLRDMTELLLLAGWRDGDVVTQQQVRYLVSRQKELNFAPGTRHDYSNTGYFLLAEIVAAVSGRSLREFAEARIFQPLGMSHTHFHDDPTLLVANRAASYETGPDGRIRAALLNYATVGSTGLLTTSRDLALWLDNFRTARVGGRALIDRMMQPGALSDGSPIDYGFGLTVAGLGGRKVLWHGGLDAGFRAIVAWFPDSETGVVLLSNFADIVPATPLTQLAGLLFPTDAPAMPAPAASPPLPKPPARYATFAGDYLTAMGASLRIKSDHGALSMQFQGRWHALTAIAPNEFVAPAANVQLKFPAAGAVDEVQFIYVGHALKARRVERIVSPPTATLAALAGLYFSPELDTYYTIDFDPASARLALHGGRIGSLPLEYFEPDLFVSETFQQIRFVRNGDGAVVALRIALGRVPDGVEFRRMAGT